MQESIVLFMCALAFIAGVMFVSSAAPCSAETYLTPEGFEVVICAGNAPGDGWELIDAR